MFFNQILNCNYSFNQVATVSPPKSYCPILKNLTHFLFILENLCGLDISMHTDNCTLCKVHIWFTAEIVKAVFTYKEGKAFIACLNDLRWPNPETMPTPRKTSEDANPQTIYRINTFCHKLIYQVFTIYKYIVETFFQLYISAFFSFTFPIKLLSTIVL